MTTRLLLVACAFGSLAFSQSLPTYQWVQEVDASGSDSLAGLGTDSQGNIYVAGTTASRSYPTKAAVQGSITGSGLYRINGAGWTALGLSSAAAIAVDPQNASTLYAVSGGKLVKSSDGGITFSATSLPSSQAGSIAIEPGNDQILFVPTFDQGMLKSADGGATWNAVNNGLHVQPGGQVTILNLWIDPVNPAVILAETPNGLVRSADGAANWQMTAITDNIQNVTFDTANAGVLYVNTYHVGFMKSTDYGQTFTSFSAPMISEVLPDQNHPGQLIGAGPVGLFLSTDGGVTWTNESGTPTFAGSLTPDWQNGVFYAAAATARSVVRISADLLTVTPVGPPATAYVAALAVANGQVYAANRGSADVFVTKLDPLGNIVYSTYFGGSSRDAAIAMAVDAAGNVFVTGATDSGDFPVSKGAYASSGTSFVFKLNPDGSLGYSTYFSGTSPVAIGTDGSGSAWLAGNTQGGLPVTPGVISTTFCCLPPCSSDGRQSSNEASLTRFDAAGSSLIFSTYVPGSSYHNPPRRCGSGQRTGCCTGRHRVCGRPCRNFPHRPDRHLAAFVVADRRQPGGDDGRARWQPLYRGRRARERSVSGHGGELFRAHSRVRRGSRIRGEPGAPVAVERIDAGLKSVIAATYFNSNMVSKIAVDGAGNVYLGGSTAPAGLPTRTPFQGGFASPTGYMSELSGDLSTLLFSSYFGDTENFTVSGLGIGANGSVVIGGHHWAGQRHGGTGESLAEQPGAHTAARLAHRCGDQCGEPGGWPAFRGRNHRGERRGIRQRRAALDRR